MAEADKAMKVPAERLRSRARLRSGNENTIAAVFRGAPIEHGGGKLLGNAGGDRDAIMMTVPIIGIGAGERRRNSPIDYFGAMLLRD